MTQWLVARWGWYLFLGPKVSLIIKLVPDHVCGKKGTKDLIRDFTAQILSALVNGL